MATYTVDVAEDAAGSRVELKLDGRASLPVDAGALESVDVKEVAAAAGGAEEAVERARELVGGREVDEAVLKLWDRASTRWREEDRISSVWGWVLRQL